MAIYVTNGSGVANSLHQNQLRQTGWLSFINLAAKAGVEATQQDSRGVCFGALDNDGHLDLYVLGIADPNILFAINGDGTFRDVAANAGVSGGLFDATAASVGGANNDGLLEI